MNFKVLFLLLPTCLILFSCNSESRRQHQLIHQIEDKKSELENFYVEIVNEYNLNFVENDDSKHLQLAKRLADCKNKMDQITVEDHSNCTHHSHETGEGHHDHHHSTSLQITNDDKLIVLQEFMDSLLIIKADLQRLL